MDLRHGFDIKRYIRTIPDYPKKGILFRDITTLLANLHAFRAAVDELAWPFLKGDIDYVAGIEARGFILGGAVAHVLGRGFVPIRKKGKLPHRVIGQDYALEYGVDTIEIHADAISKGDRILLIDDLVATGGTANAAIDLMRKASMRAASDFSRYASLMKMALEEKSAAPKVVKA
jgi:adenine phosphoribosyltransferase